MVNPDVIPDDFPAWMHPRPRVFQWGVVAAALFGLMIGWAFFVRSGIPAVTIGTHTAFMADDFSQALQAGEALPLWSPYARDRKTPIAQFTAQGAAYVIALIDVFFTDNTAEALRVMMIGALISAAIGMYGLVTAWGLRWGVVATALYLFAPFVGLTVPHVLVDPALTLVHAFFPLIMLVATLLLQGARRWTIVFGVLILGLFGLIHPPAALAGWLGGFVLLMLNHGRKVIWFWLGIGLGGLGVSAPLWLPAVLLASEVIWLPSTQIPTYTVSLSQWLSPILTPAVIPQFTLGFVLPILMVSTWVYQLRGGGRWGLLATGTLGVGVSAVGCLVYPAEWWLSVASFWAAAAAAGILAFFDEQIPVKSRRWATLIGVILVIIISLPVFVPPSGATTTDFSTEAQIRYEQRTGSSAFLPAGHPFPSLRENSVMLNPTAETSPQFVAWLAVGCTGLALALYLRKP